MKRHGFTLTELLVAIAIILIMVTLASVAASAARTSAKETGTRALVNRLSNVVVHHFATFESRTVPASVTNSASRAAYLRNLVTAEMPDSWEDVRLIATGSAGVPLTTPQRTYKSIWDNLSTTQKDSTVSNLQYVGKFNGDAECLFMMVMQGGIADCLTCGGLSQAQIGDTDTDPNTGNPVPDGMPEFLDAWGQPIRYVVWPAKLELPPQSGPFFSTTAPFSTGTPLPARGGTMRPLIFSLGADKKGSTVVNEGNNLNPTNQANCGDPALINFGGFDGVVPDYRADNITNFDAEARQ